MRKNSDKQHRPMDSWMPEDDFNNKMWPVQPIHPGHMPGHMHDPMPYPVPYPWMQRPMPGHLMPLMWERPVPPTSGTPMELWSMPQWNMQMWEPDFEDDPQEMRDMEYWQQLYPEQTRRIQREVAHQCDLLDYEGSVIYDEYPDRISLARICESVYNALVQNGIIGNSDNDLPNSLLSNDPSNGPMDGENYDPIESVDMMQYRRPNQRPSRTLQNLIEVLLYQEMHQRRRRRRRNRRWW